MKHEVIGTRLRKVLLVLFVAFMLATGGVLLSACGSISLSVNFVVDGEIVKTVDTNGNEVITVPENPTKDGYEFAGWYWDYGTWMQPFTANSLLDAPISSDMNVYAHFNATQYSIFYHDGGDVNLNQSYYTIEGPVSLVEPSRSGYTFCGWYFDEEHTKQASYISYETYRGNPVDIYAVWSIKTSTITFNSNGGSSVESITGIYGSSIDAPADPIKDNYVFAGWYLDEGLSTPYTISTIPADDITLYAKWTSPKYYTIQYVTDGTNPNSSFTQYNSGDIYAFSDSYKTDYTFLGWYTDANYETQITNLTGCDKNLVLYAKFCYGTDGLTYSYDVDTAEATITGYTGTASKVVIPSTFNGYAVTKIAVSAFSNCTSITSITVPNSVTYIGNSAFKGCSGLVSLTLPFVGTSSTAVSASSSTLFGVIFGTSGYTGGTAITQYYTETSGVRYYIPDSLENVTITGKESVIYFGAFYGCYNLRNVVLNGTSIGNYAFKECSSLTNVTIGQEIERIGSYAFYGCSNIQTLEFDGDSLCTEIGLYAFCNCSKLTEIKIPDMVTSIGFSVFSGCSSLISITIPYVSTFGEFFGTTSYTGGSDTKQYYSSDDYNIYYIPTTLTSVTIANGNIGSYAFYNCAYLRSITISDNVTSIGNYAFYNCTALTQIDFNAKELSDLTSGNYVFYMAGQSGNGITVNIGTNVTKIPAYLFCSCSSIISVVFTEGSLCKSIGSFAFSYLTSLVNIVLPDSLLNIGDNAFRNCTSLTDINIPNGVTVISDYSFYGCSKLEDIIISENVTSIGCYAFACLTSLLNISIPKNVSNVAAHAFYDCTSLTAVYVDDINTWLSFSFEDSYSNPIFYAQNLYILNGENYILLTELTISSNITKINNYAFYNCTSLLNASIGSAVESIGEYSFYNCSGLKNITIPDKVTNIGKYAFYTCTSLTNVIIPNGVTTISDYSFYGCSTLTNFTIPENVTSIGYYAFAYMTSLLSITIPSSVTTIKEKAFEGCTSVTSVMFSETNGWYVGSKSLSSTDLEDNSKAAYYLTSYYSVSLWTLKEE